MTGPMTWVILPLFMICLPVLFTARSLGSLEHAEGAEKTFVFYPEIILSPVRLAL
jgi:hypothetical protein